MNILANISLEEDGNIDIYELMEAYNVLIYTLCARSSNLLRFKQIFQEPDDPMNLYCTNTINIIAIPTTTATTTTSNTTTRSTSCTTTTTSDC